MKRFPWRAILYALILLYLLIDLRWCKGPLRKKLDERRTTSVEAAQKNGWVAIVNQEPITSQQLDFAVFRHQDQRGKANEELSEKTNKIIRRAVLQTVINDTLVRQYADGEKFRAPESEIAAFIESWNTQFLTEDDREERSAIQGLSQEQREAELARIWSRKRWIEQRIEPAVVVSEEEAREWFEANKEEGSGFREPQRVRARHIFLSTVQADSKEQEARIRNAYLKLTDPEEPADFAALAKEISDDARSKIRGGDLNWFSHDRVPEDFAEPVFKLKPGETSEPFQTTIGWHIVRVEEVKADQPVTFDEVKDEIRAHLANQRRRETFDILMKKLRTVAKIELFPENI